ncbi:MAG TPA: hypothetical protein VFS00_26835 [Polyangiaceae bacterium]|nr:hypothetical protein [Polyangiaceae bacterium]
MTAIPTTINGVNVEFGEGTVNDVSPALISALHHCITTNVAAGHVLTRIYVSSAYDSHSLPSRHMQKKAVDISRINGVKIAVAYPQGGAVTSIVNAIQARFESFAGRRENFGPSMKKKSGQAWSVDGHDDHIHLSVD